MIRNTIYYLGRVQGVGFRYTCCECAENCVVAGYVMNLPDGRVKLVAEGEKEELKALIENISKRMSRNIHNQTVDTSQANGEFGVPATAALRIKY
ncbi:MAG: acylphosphatase [Phycisphaeraceae bacterium]|nr:acylphosphatase [Phycisphaeraceae bacterium]